MTKPQISQSVRRVEDAAAAAGLSIRIQHMEASTKTAQDAANVCGCAVDQIVKSLIFEGRESKRLLLFLVSGAHQLCTKAAEMAAGEAVGKADAARIREETGFAIGGVSPLGHLAQPPSWIDSHLFTFPEIWAAAGTPNALFKTTPTDIETACKAKRFLNTANS